MWFFRLITAPAKEPLDLKEDVYKHLRLEQHPDIGAEDTLLNGLIQAARHSCETSTGRQLIDATWELVLDSWWEAGIAVDEGLLIPKPPLRSITSVKYLDTGGTLQTLAATEYSVEVQDVAAVAPMCQRGRLYPKYGVIWPTLQCMPGAVTIRFTAGYGTDSSKVPAGLKQGMLLEIAEMYERRELAVVGAIVSPGLLSSVLVWSPYIDGHSMA